MYKYFLGLKYLISRPINMLGTLGVAIAVWALVVVISVFTGFIKDVRDHIRGGLPDLTLLDESLTTSYEDVEKVLRGDPEVAAVAPRIKLPALIYPEKGRQREGYLRVGPTDIYRTPFFHIVGIDFEREAEILPLRSWLRSEINANRRARDPNAPFATDAVGAFGHRPAGLLLGSSRTGFRVMQPPAFVGDRVILASARRVPGSGVQPVKRTLVMTGAFRADDKHREIEKTNAFVDIETARSMLGNDPDDPDSLDVTTEVSVALLAGADLDAAKTRLNDALTRAELPAGIVTWEERKARFLDAVEYERGIMKLVLFVLMIVACFLIFATVSMMVTKKTRDIGIIAALGATRRGVLMIFLVAGGVIGLLGAVFGIAVGLVTCQYLNELNDTLQFFPKSIYGLASLPHETEPLWVAQVGLGAVATALLFSLMPAVRASRFDPVRALRFE